MTTTPASIKLNNNHGLFEVPAEKLEKAIISSATLSVTGLRSVVEGSAGYQEDDLADCTWIELLIIWLESGNHPF